MAKSLWGEAFDIPDTGDEVKKCLKKISAPKELKVTSVKDLKSTKISMKEKLTFIEKEVLRILGVYKENTAVIRDIDSFSSFIDKAIENGIIAIDTETNNSLDPITCKIMGLCLYTPGLKQTYIPVNHVDGDGNLLSNQITEQQINAQLSRLGDTKVIVHNGEFDYRVIKCTTGYQMKMYWDTMVGARMLDENEKSAGLKQQYIEKIDPSIEKYNIEDLFMKMPYEIFDPELFALYAATDAYMTYRLYQWQLEQFNQPGNERLKHVFLDIEMPIVEVAAEMELTGVAIDVEYAYKLKEKYEKRISIVEENIQKILQDMQPQIAAWRSTLEANEHPSVNGREQKSKNEKLAEPLNVGSATQLAIIIYDILKTPVIDKDMPRGTGEDILLKIDHPLCKEILAKRGLEKILSTYVEAIPESINQKTGRLHAHFKPTGTDCIVSDSVILTSTGVSTIKNIIKDIPERQYIEFEYPLINENNEVEYTSHKIKFNNVATCKIELPYGFELEGTPNHPIRVFDGEKQIWKKLGDVQLGDIVLINKQKHPFKQDYIPTQFRQDMKPHTHWKNASLKMPEYFDEDFAELLGMFHADGSLVCKSGSWRLILHNEQPEVVKRWIQLCEKLFNQTPQHIKKYSNIITGYIIRGLKLSQLTKYIHTGKTQKRIPQEILNSRDSVFNAYIKGLTLDANNRLPKRDRISISLFDFTDARACQLRFLAQGVLSRVNKSDISNDRYESVLTFRYEALEWFIKNVGTVQSEKTRDLNTKRGKKPPFLEDETFLYLPIQQIHSSQNTVYDFTLPKTHSFISNGIISHNTGRFACVKPNLQNIPSHEKSIRLMFKASPGNIMVGADFSLLLVG